MGGIVRILIALLVLLSSIGFIVYHISQFLLGITSVKRLIRRDFKKLAKIVKEFDDGLIPMNIEELQLLSSHPIARLKKRSRYIICKGYMATIYQEPLFAFAIKRYRKSGRLLMYVKSDQAHYKFLGENGEVKVYKDEHYRGYITPGGKYYSEKDEEKARIERSTGVTTAAVVSESEEVAYLNLKDEDGLPSSDRAFSMFHEIKTEDADRLTFMALYHILIKQNLKLG